MNCTSSSDTSSSGIALELVIRSNAARLSGRSESAPREVSTRGRLRSRISLAIACIRCVFRAYAPVEKHRVVRPEGSSAPRGPARGDWLDEPTTLNSTEPGLAYGPLRAAARGSRGHRICRFRLESYLDPKADGAASRAITPLLGRSFAKTARTETVKTPAPPFDQLYLTSRPDRFYSLGRAFPRPS